MSEIMIPSPEGQASAPMLKLPLEMIQEILQYLIPHVAVTPRGSWSDNPRLNPAFIAARTTLSNLSKTCRTLNRATEALLYKLVVLRNRRELVCFFRTLVTVPSRRSIVRTLVWIGVLSRPSPRGWPTHLQRIAHLPNISAEMRAELETDSRQLMDAWGCLGEESVDEEMVKVVSECWRPYHLDWPQPCDEDHQIALLLDLNKDERSLAERFYRGTLAMLPHLRVLFTVFGMLSAPFPVARLAGPKSPEGHALEYVVSCAHVPSLRNLKTAIFECHSDELAQTRTPATALRCILRHCRSLRHIYIKGLMHWRNLLLLGTETPDPKIISNTVEEISICRSQRPFDAINVIAAVFPKLRKLRAEYDIAPQQLHLISREGLHLRRLPALAETLETLHLSTTPGKSWCFTHGIPTLAPLLKGMHCLKSLTTECIWLFGRQDLHVALDLFSILPRNLNNLCISDYWGFQVVDDSLYYPVFPDNMTPSKFMLEILHNFSASYAKSPGRMRDLRVLFPHFGLSTAHDNTNQNLRGGICLAPIQDSYARLGIDFSVGMIEEFETYQQGEWCSLA